MGGLERNEHSSKKPQAGCGAVDRTAVVGGKERESKKVEAKVTENTKRPTLMYSLKPM